MALGLVVVEVCERNILAAQSIGSLSKSILRLLC